MSKTRVLVIDDSALIRKLLTEILDGDPDIQVVGTAPDPYVARERIKALHPDVLTLDVEMPRMDGITFLGNLMRLHPLPVVMVSSLTEKGADITLRALELGAVDFVAKPKIDLQHGMNDYADEIRAKVKMASRVPRAQLMRGASQARSPSGSVKEDMPQGRQIPAPGVSRLFRTTDVIIAIGASTGGTEAIREVLMAMPADSPGIVITQHIPAEFSAPFARRMDSLSPLSVCEAQDGQQILPGHAYVAPGGRHLSVVRSGARYVCALDDGEPVNRHRPSVDVLFNSVAQHAGMNAVGALLTGMGSDGARGLEEMLQAGAHTIAQDEATSVVWGMPGEAVKRGAARQVLRLSDIAPALLRAAHGRRGAGSAERSIHV